MVLGYDSTVAWRAVALSLEFEHYFFVVDYFLFSTETISYTLWRAARLSS